jgi:predicted metal-dependent phosphoesterase TrpH
VEVLFLTDHDSVSGFPEAEEAARGTSVKVFCGIEINTAERDGVHILGYGLRWRDAAFRARLEDFRARRERRVEQIVENLRRHGVDVSVADVRGASHEALGRPHVADALRRKGIVQSRQEAFNRFLIRGKPGYAEPMGPSPAEAIALIRDAGGFSSLAHPETVSDASRIKQWAELGLEGLEVYYAGHSANSLKRFSDIAGSLGLLPTGGSDFHGPGSGREGALGVDVPDEVFARFTERLSRCG